jgi:hypothetical protein
MTLHPVRCPHRSWERCLEIRDGIECVMRVCLGCGRSELVWSRRRIPAGVNVAATQISGRTGPGVSIISRATANRT